MATGRRGRPQVSSRAQVEVAAFELFLERGYAETSIMDIVAAAGISKTTFFRYFSSKAALVWFPFEESTRDLQRSFGTVDDEVPVMEAIRVGVIDTVAARLDDEGVWTARFGSSTPHRNCRPRVLNGGWCGPRSSRRSLRPVSVRVRRRWCRLLSGVRCSPWCSPSCARE